MTNFLTVQNTYLDVQIALFDPTSLKLRRAGALDMLSVSKIDASKMLIPLIHSLLDKNSLTLSQLKFIAANRGPGPFTTLRTILASVNGLAFATGLPLIGIDSLDALVHESVRTACPPKLYAKAGSSERASRPDTSASSVVNDPSNQAEVLPVLSLSKDRRVVLLNAFNQDVYFAISHENQTHRGCQKIQTLLFELANQFPHSPLHFIGHGASMHQELIRATLGARALFDDPIPESPSIETIAAMALKKWERQEDLVGQLLPVYLK